MIRTPAQHQRDPRKAAGQRVRFAGAYPDPDASLWPRAYVLIGRLVCNAPVGATLPAISALNCDRRLLQPVDPTDIFCRYDAES